MSSLIHFKSTLFSTLLLNSPVITDILNGKKLSPIHLATELNKASALQVMANYSNQFDVQQGGEHGRTALHLAAMYDHEECAKILVWKMVSNFHFYFFNETTFDVSDQITEFGASPRAACNLGRQCYLNPFRILIFNEIS